MPRGQTFSESLKHAGKSVRELLEDLLEDAVRKFLEMKDTPLIRPDKNSSESHWGTYIEAEKLLASQRGQVRMAARAVLVWRNCYYKDRVRSVKEIEKEFVQRVKGSPPSKLGE